MRIQHNIMAMNAYRNYTNNTSALAKNLERLSSGYKINRAGDDAAGLAISEKMRAQITGLDAAQKNVKDGVSLVNTAEGAMQEIQDMLNRMVYLATQSANGTYDDEVDRKNLQAEVDQLSEEINRIADSANFNGIKLLDGSLGESTVSTGSMVEGDVEVNMIDGITINAPENGTGAKQQYEISFAGSGLMGKGDEITLNLTDANGDAQTVTVAHGTDITATDTLKNQLSQAATALNTAFDASSYGYTAAVNEAGDGITITAKELGKQDVTIDDVKITDAMVGAATTVVAGTADTAQTSDSAAAATIIDLSNGGTAGPHDEITVGDTFEFEFTVNGKTMTAKVEVTADMIEPGTNDKKTIENIAAKLQDANFEDSSTTATVDESLLKVSDYFTITPNKDENDAAADGAIQAKPKSNTAGDPIVTFNKVVWTPKGEAAKAAITASGAGDAAAAANDSAAEVAKSTFSGTDANFVAGDQYTVAGTLKDGREFSITLTGSADGSGVNEFEVGTDVATTLSNIKDALVKNTNKVTITNADGTPGDEITADKLFAASGTGADFVVATADSTGVGGDADQLTFTNAIDTGKTGVGLGATINAAKTRFTTTNKKVEASLTQTVEGAENSNAVNKLAFDPTKVEQGTTITIDGKTYEFVNEAANTTHEDNIAVTVENLGDTATPADIANALKDAMTGGSGNTYTAVSGDAAGQVFDLSVNEAGQLIMTSQDIGSDVKAMDIEMGKSKPTSSLKINSVTENVTAANPDGTSRTTAKAGDSVTVGGVKYEFTVGGKRTEDENAVAVDLGTEEELKTMTSAQVAEKLADAVNEKNRDAENPGNVIARAEGDTVIFTSKYHDDVEVGVPESDPTYADKLFEATYAAPSIELPTTTTNSGLVLQIGDTSESYNQLTVTIKDMHVDALRDPNDPSQKSIGEISIAKPEDAKAAIDAIRGAINYVSEVRGRLGAISNRLDHTSNNLSVMKENITDAESAIRDTDIAEEMMAYTKNNILVQSAQAMLAQANQVPQGVLQLLQ